MRIAITGLLLGVSAALTAVSITVLPFYDRTDLRTLPLITLGLWALFAAAYFLLRRVPRRAAVILVLAGSIAIGGAAMAGPPNTSTDSARYAWDGIVQNAGISPYRYVPASSHLETLRPAWLFPATVDGKDGAQECRGERIQKTHEPGTRTVVCTAMNRAKSPTIYPPSSELLFAAERFIVGPNAQYWPMQLTGLLMSLGITLMLVQALVRRGLDPRWAALWGWSPLAATEAVTNSHIDTLGALLLLAASLLVSSGKRWRGGIALGAAIAAKLIPVIGAPALLRRQPWKIILASVVTFLVLYVPYVLGSGIKVLGYLPKYLGEEGYNDGGRFALISLLVHGDAATVVAAALLAILAGFVVWKTDPASPWLGQVVMIGGSLIVLAPRYPWYALLLVPMVAMSGRWEWMTIALALTARGLEPHVWVTRTGLGAALVIVVVASIVRYHHRAPRPGGPPRSRIAPQPAAS